MPRSWPPSSSAWWKRAAQPTARPRRRSARSSTLLQKFGLLSLDQSDMTREQLPISAALGPDVHVADERLDHCRAGDELRNLVAGGDDQIAEGDDAHGAAFIAIQFEPSAFDHFEQDFFSRDQIRRAVDDQFVGPQRL